LVVNINNMGKKILYYQCKSCVTAVLPNTGGVFTSCKCGKMAIDGTSHYTRIIGNMDYVDQITEEPSPEFVYRIKQVKSGLFFFPRRGYVTAHFSKTGKFYGKKPSLRWVEPHHGECVVEKYIIKKCTGAFFSGKGHSRSNKRSRFSNTY